MLYLLDFSYKQRILRATLVTLKNYIMKAYIHRVTLYSSHYIVSPKISILIFFQF